MDQVGPELTWNQSRTRAQLGGHFRVFGLFVLDSGLRISSKWTNINLPNFAKLKLLLRLSGLYCVLSTWSSLTPFLSCLSWFSILHSWFSSIAPKSPFNSFINSRLIVNVNLDKVSASPPVVVVGDRTPSEAVVVETLIRVNHDVWWCLLWSRGYSWY